MESYPGNLTADPDSLRGDEKILQQARDRFRACVEWQSQADKWWLEDVKFANADARNHHQWPEDTWQDRDDDNRPCLTINKTRVHNDIIVNESLKNKSSIKVRPTGGSATFESAQAMQAIIRWIEYISKADSVYEKAIRDQVDGGLGYIFLDTRYANERTFDQNIYLTRCTNPLQVYLDPDIKEADGLDAGYGFIFDNLSRENFNRKYPKYKNRVGKSTLGNDENWLNQDQIQVAMYYTREETKDQFISYVEPNSGERVEKLASEIREESGEDLLEALLLQIENGEIDGRTREVFNQTVKWYKIGGDLIMDRGEWAGSYVPIIRCVGVETVIEGQYDRKGHTRALIDPQRMLNYNASAQIEFGALQNKAPYIGPARAFEGQEQWKDANRKNYAFMQYNDVDEEAEDPQLAIITAPKRQDPPKVAPIYMQGMQDSERQMMMVSGQFQAQLGEEDQQSAASGKAINERQRQGETATYHFIEHQGDMYRAVGIQLLDLIPKILDTERRLHVLGEDGTKRWMAIAPDQKEALLELKQQQEEVAILSLNPKVGEYDCMADTGPNYATQRQEAWNAISIILQQNMQLASVIGDLLFKFGDFPGSDEIMERLKKEIQATKPYLFDDSAPPQVMALQQQNQRLVSLNSELVQKLAMSDIQRKGRDERRDVEAYRAETERMKAQIEILAKHLLSPAQQAQMEHEIELKSHEGIWSMIQQANAAEIGAQATGANEK